MLLAVASIGLNKTAQTRKYVNISRDDVAEVTGTPIEKLDFSQFHPLDHPIWSADCTTYYGGRRNHAALWRDYKAPSPLQTVKCRLGRHDWTMYWRSVKRERGVSFSMDEDNPTGYMCRACHVDKP